MKLSTRGFVLIQTFEGCKLKAYLCPAGKWTVGFGETGPDVTKDTVLKSIGEAEGRLLKRLEVYEVGVSKLLGDTKASQGQFDGLVCFAYNVGLNALAKSTLLKKFKAGDFRGAGEEFLKWNKATVKGKKVVLKGLTTRREAERKLFAS